MEILSKLFNDFKSIITIVGSALLGVGVRVVIESQDKKITLWYFLSGFFLGCLGSWFTYSYLQAVNDKQVWYLSFACILAAIVAFPLLQYLLTNMKELLDIGKNLLIKKFN